jgi:hypothetical protein
MDTQSVCVSWEILDKSTSSLVKMSTGNQDVQFYQLIVGVIKSPDGSLEQINFMNNLLKLIPNLKGICKHYDSCINYQEPLNLALTSISIYNGNVSGYYFRKLIYSRQLDIDNDSPYIFRPKFIKWFNRILKNKITDVYRRISKQDLSLDNQDEPVAETLSGIDQIIREEQEKVNVPIGRQLWNYIEEDSEGILRNCHPKNCSQANCQELAKRLLLKNPPDKLTDIARDLNVNNQTLNAHWKRTCLPLLRSIAKRFGYR